VTLARVSVFVLRPSFFAIEIRPGIHYTMGGVLIDNRAQVLSADG